MASIAQAFAAFLLIATTIVEIIRLVLKLINIFDDWKAKRGRGTVPGAGPLGATPAGATS